MSLFLRHWWPELLLGAGVLAFGSYDVVRWLGVGS
jgi:hypothetical protein